MEIIKAKEYNSETATIEIYGETHEIKNPKNGQELEFYGKKYQLQLEEPKEVATPKESENERNTNANASRS